MKGDYEREKLIREGQMTPFGTTSNASKTVSFPRPSKIYTEKHLYVGEKKSTLKSKTEMISCGEMTPFGTILESADTSNRLKYMYFLFFEHLLEVTLIRYSCELFSIIICLF